MKWIDHVVAGNISPDTIDDYLKAWHEMATLNTSLWKFLGMTQAEYKQWAENPDALADIIQKRRAEKGGT